MSKKVLVPIADGVEEVEALSIIDVLRRANAAVTSASVSNNLQITAAHGVKIIADELLAKCADKTYDLIVLPGGMPGAEHLRDSAVLINMLRKQKQENKLFAAICASPAVVLQHHGLIDDLQATCYPALLKQLKNPVDSRVVVDKNCITSQGPGTALEFALALVNALFGQSKSEQIAKNMLVVN